MPAKKTPRRKSRNIIGANVRKARELSGNAITQDQLAGKLAALGTPLDRVTIAKIETGLRCVYDFEVVALAKALKVEVGWLLECSSDSSARKVSTQARR
jgi:hypothetical protein